MFAAEARCLQLVIDASGAVWRYLPTTQVQRRFGTDFEAYRARTMWRLHLCAGDLL